MGGMLENFLSHITDAAQSPAALFAYLAVVVAWTVIAWQVQRNKNLLRHLQDLPPGDRLEAIKAEMRVIPTAAFDPEQYIRARIHLFVLSGYLCTLAAVVLIFVMALSGSVTGTIN